MRRARIPLVWLSAWLLACPAAPAWPAPGPAAASAPDLPPSPAVQKALHAHPAVVAAEAAVRVEEAQRDRLEAGPHEFTVRLSNARRREAALDRRLNETEVALERALRLPGKAARDAEIGAAGLAAARYARGDALHETARLMLKTWFDWLREDAAAREWAAQAELLRRQAEIAERRVALGDAARLEAMLARAQQTQAEAGAAQAGHRAATAALEFTRHFPAIALPDRPVQSRPVPVAGSLETWREAMLSHNHELKLAEAASGRQQALARRADAERLPDPTLGLRWGSERDGAERVVGVHLIIPLPGAGREASARASRAEVDAAAAREALVRSRVEAEARQVWQRAGAAHAHWQRMEEVAARMEDNAALLEKAWRHGEGQIGDLLAARRQALEARLGARQAQLDANEARYRLLLDTHELWPLDADDEHDAH